mgnify:CR=1 FL=1
MDKHPNIILLMADQMRGDCLGIAGHPDVKTPFLDALAAEAAQTQGYVRLWLGPSPDEACGFLFACSLLAHAVCRVGVVVLGGLHPGPQGTLVQLAAGGELAPEALGAFSPIEKITFSAMGEPDFTRVLAETGKKNVILIGIETHICVQQTALQLAEAGYNVYVI